MKTGCDRAEMHDDNDFGGRELSFVGSDLVNCGKWANVSQRNVCPSVSKSPLTPIVLPQRNAIPEGVSDAEKYIQTATSDRGEKAGLILCVAINFCQASKSSQWREGACLSVDEREYVEYYRQVHRIVSDLHDVKWENFILRMTLVNFDNHEKLHHTIKRIHEYYQPKFFFLHFYGHGGPSGIRYGEKSKTGYLNDIEISRWINKKMIPCPNLIVFNACESKALAQRLVKSCTVNQSFACLGCEGKISPSYIRTFVARFYYQLSLHIAKHTDGLSLDSLYKTIRDGVRVESGLETGVCICFHNIDANSDLGVCFLPVQREKSLSQIELYKGGAMNVGGIAEKSLIFPMGSCSGNVYEGCIKLANGQMDHGRIMKYNVD